MCMERKGKIILQKVLSLATRKQTFQNLNEVGKNVSGRSTISSIIVGSE